MAKGETVRLNRGENGGRIDEAGHTAVRLRRAMLCLIAKLVSANEMKAISHSPRDGMIIVHIDDRDDELPAQCSDYLI